MSPFAATPSPIDVAAGDPVIVPAGRSRKVVHLGSGQARRLDPCTAGRTATDWFEA